MQYHNSSCTQHICIYIQYNSHSLICIEPCFYKFIIHLLLDLIRRGGDNTAGGEIKKTGYSTQYLESPRHSGIIITRTLAGLRTSIKRQKLPFSMFFQMVIGALGIFSHRFFSTSNFMIFPSFAAFSGFPLHGNPILTSDLDSSSNFTSIIVVRIFFFPLV